MCNTFKSFGAQNARLAIINARLAKSIFQALLSLTVPMAASHAVQLLAAVADIEKTCCVRLLRSYGDGDSLRLVVLEGELSGSQLALMLQLSGFAAKCIPSPCNNNPPDFLSMALFYTEEEVFRLIERQYQQPREDVEVAVARVDLARAHARARSCDTECSRG